MILVFAHGLVQRSSLPIPEWLFGWAAAAVLCVSFVALAALWPRPRLEHTGWRPLPGGIGRVLGSRTVEVICGALGVLLLAFVLVSGYDGPDTPLDNFAPTFVFIIFWVGLVFASVLFGDLFRAFNPWRAIGRVLFRDRRLRDYPESFGRWPAAIGLLVFTWIELGSGWGEEPATLATAVAGYSVLTLIFMGVYGVEPWSRWARRSRSTSTSSRGCRCSRRATGSSGRARSWPASRGSTRCPARSAIVIVMIGSVTLRRAQPGPVVEGPRGPPQRRLRLARLQPRDDAEARRRCRPGHRRVDRRRLLRARHRGRALGRRRPRPPSACGARSRTAWCRSRWSTSPRTT